MKKTAGRIPSPRAATPDEVKAAAESLTPGDLLRLGAVAESLLRVASLRDRGADDLLHEAIARTLSSERRWEPSRVPFEQHLYGAMKSIANHWWEECWVTRVDPEAALTFETSDGNEKSMLVDVSVGQNPEEELAAKQQIVAIENILHGDYEASLLFESLRYDHNGPEIRENLGWSQNEYETIQRRMLRKIRKGIVNP